ncbi:hypothetical protein B0H66DRAFT_225887 [Apodospora peruviana]|uniref:Tetratricopeptide repeat domain-containing protein n=1 Tax=Apodospora peruviana TaxID=516989 RepID=A0AAE0M511_9PEZI|nr:hypothetical protein B0H66DRAFT_225887 [Apodospora peruviana]
MDPLSVVAGAASLADICVRTIAALRQLKHDAGDIVGQLGALVHEVEGLNNMCNTIQARLKACGKPDEDEPELARKTRAQMQQTLLDSRRVIAKLSGIVQKIYGHRVPSELGKRDAYKMAIRKMFHENEMRNCRVQLADYQKTLHLFLTILTNQDINEFSESFQNISESLHSHLNDLHDSTKAATDFHYDAATLDTLKQLREAVDAASVKMNMLTSNQHFDIPQSVRSIFTGRETELRDLRQFFIPKRGATRDNGPGQRRFIVYGMGGSGKTQFCSKFAQDNQDSFWGVFWIDASTQDRLKMTLGNIAAIAGLEKNENAALHWLSTLDKTWLLIIDNADDPDIPLENYFPKSNRGNILVTTRNPAYRFHGNVGPGSYKFEGLTTKDGIQLLLKASAEPEPWDATRQRLAEEINAKLGSLALAIIHAGAAIRDQLCDLKDYLGYYFREWNRIRNAGILLEEPVHTPIFTTWEMCYQQLVKRESRAARDAMQLLNTFAFFHHESISQDILNRAMKNAHREAEVERFKAQEAVDDCALSNPESRPNPWVERTKEFRAAILTFVFQNRSPTPLPDVIRYGRQPGCAEDGKDRVRKALNELSVMSLITYNDHNKTYSMHPIVHTWARQRPQMTLADQAFWADVAGRVLACSILLPPGLTGEDEKYNVSLLSHVEHVQVRRESIAKQLTAEWAARRGPLSWLASWVPMIGPDEGKMRMFGKFALVYAMCGQWKSAEMLLKPVTDTLNQYLGPENKRARDATRMLSEVYWHLGRIEDCARIRSAAVETCKRHLGSSHPDTLRAMADLGRTYWLQGKLTEARRLQEPLLRDMKKHLPAGDSDAEHEDALHVMDQLGSTEHKMWNFVKAYRLHSEAVKGMKIRHGEKHPRTLEAKENMCRAVVMLNRDVLEKSPDLTKEALETRQGLIKEALETRQTAHDIMQEVLETRKTDKGKEHPYTLLAMLNTAVILTAAGRANDAEELMREGLQVADRNLGPDYMGTMHGRQVLAGILIEQGRYAEAESILVRVTEGQKRIPSPRGDVHPDRLGSLIELCRCSFLMGKINRAIEICDEAIHGFESIDAQDHPLARDLRTARVEMEMVAKSNSPVFDHDHRPVRHNVKFPSILFTSA